MRKQLTRLVTLGLAIILAATAYAGEAIEDDAQPQNRPNILFIMSDDHGYQALGCYGSRVNETPNLDRIAEEGMRFDRCFVTNSICGPCRAVILTGKYSHLNGFVRNGNRFNGEQQTVAKLLQNAGYQTAVVGKWHLGSDPTGFDYWHILQGQGPYYNPVMLTPEGRVSHTGYTTDIITDLALDWLQNERQEDQPFFLVYQHKAPHRNWQPGPKYLNKYDDVTIPEPETLFDDYEGRGTAAHEQKMSIEFDLNEHDLKLSPQRGRFTDEQLEAWNEAYDEKNRQFREAELEGDALIRWKYQRYVKDYLRCVDSVDENVGRVLDYLDESGLDENTIVIYTSDQGWYLGEHGWYDKRWMYEESFRTPLMIRWPGEIEPGSVSSDMVMNLDFAQTFLEIAGEPIPDDMQGESIVPVLDGEAPDDWRTSVYYHYYEFPGPHSVHKHYGVRNERYKLIYFYDLDEWELYDLEADPNEMNSVYEDPDYAETVDQMKAELDRLREKYADDGSIVDFDVERARNVETERVLVHATDQAVEFGDEPLLEVATSEIDPAYKPFAVAGWFRLDEPDGVLVAHGGGSLGYSLYVKEGRPHLAVRSQGALNVATGPDIRLDRWFHLIGTVDADGVGQLYVNGREWGVPSQVGIIKGSPAEGMSIGTDTDSAVADYDFDITATGATRNVQVYWGAISEETIKHLSDPGDWFSLFDGDELEHWNVIEQHFFDKHGDIAIEEGEIRVARGQPASGIVLDRDFPRIDYEFQLEAKRLEGSDFFCGLTFPVNDEYLTLILGGWGGGVIGISNLDGFSAVENETTQFKAFENDRWYAVRLRVSQERIEAWVDDEMVVGLRTDSHRHSIWWEQEPARPLGIVTWNTSAAFRELRMRELWD